MRQYIIFKYIYLSSRTLPYGQEKSLSRMQQVKKKKTHTHKIYETTEDIGHRQQRVVISERGQLNQGSPSLLPGARTQATVQGGVSQQS